MPVSHGNQYFTMVYSSDMVVLTKPNNQGEFNSVKFFATTSNRLKQAEPIWDLLNSVCAHVCSMHGYHMHGNSMSIPHVAHDKLQCMLHATRKRGPHKHITGLFILLPCVSTSVQMKL